jgi:electron transfer flavoprotein beta subunit
MNIFVCLKQVPDTETKIRLTADGSGVDPTSIQRWIVSSYDEYAIEESLRLRDKNPGSTVTVVSAGPARVTEALRTALAMGADTGIHVELPDGADNNLAAKALAGALLKQPKIDVVFTGKEAFDDTAAQTSQLLAEYLSLPVVTVVLGIEYGSGSVRCKREIEGGAYELVETPLPAVIAAQKGLNEPRYASLPNIMKAKKKEIKVLKMAEVGVTAEDQKVRLSGFKLPPQKQAGKKLAGDARAQARELARLLREEAKVV